MSKAAVTQKGGFKKAPKGALKKVIKYVAQNHKKQIILVTCFVIISSILSASTGIFQKILIDNVITPGLETSFNDVAPTLYLILGVILTCAIINIISTLMYTQIMARVTQKVIYQFRVEMFNKMQSFPVKYFDQTPHGDIMSAYTNDTDSLRQFINQTFIAIVTTSITIIYLLCMMFYFNIMLAVLVLLGVFCLFKASKSIGSKMGKYFGAQQHCTGELEGYVEEMMEGQRVVKVFNYEEKAMEKFIELNNNLQKASTEANKRANILMPVLNNMGHFIYIMAIITGSIFIYNKIPNISIERLFGGDSLVTFGVVMAFVPMTKQLTNSLAQISQQLPMFGMALAGSKRIFDLIEQEPETDNGYVTMVKGYFENENFIETNKLHDKWYWKYPHTSYDGTTYHEVKGDIVLENVDFGYNETKLVLKDISVYAKPGEKIALVGSTGAGKTTITNIINRFYDIADGKCRYDGININKIKKYDLRKSLGVVLQDTNLFTGTVFENIAYGVVNATEEQVIAAAKIANAYDFITRLPNGFNTILENNAANLSQGQRQLLSIARAACADAPVMILDEATSSIDTRTEVLVQNGMNKLMEGRTVFVIAHRLSTIKNSDCIMVLENGSVIEKGNHESLIRNKKTYYSFYTGKIELS